MANPEHVEIVKQGVAAVAAWRNSNPFARLDLIRVNLSDLDLSEMDLSGADLRHSIFVSTNLYRTNFMEAHLHGAMLINVNLRCANFINANLTTTKLLGAHLSGASFEAAMIGDTVFADVDLSEVEGLEFVQHFWSSTVGTDTLYKSQGKIPEVFLRGCGVPDDFITFMPSLVAQMQPIQYNSCFISYSHQDEEFARWLYDSMRGKHLRVWFAPEDMQEGKKLIEQIDRAIQVNDQLLLVLSEHSMNSEWVKTEIRNARQAELREQRQKLFPIRLVSIDRIREWSCFDADTGKDLAVELREYHIPDFSNWKDHDAFESAFADLLRDLRAQA